MKETLVIAKYNEDTKWSDEFIEEGWDRFIVQKDIHMPNTGREPASYFWYIIENYEDLKGTYVFSQGNPFDHFNLHTGVLDGFTEEEGFRWFGKRWGCRGDGSPTHPGLAVAEGAQEFFNDNREDFPFMAGCIFAVTAEKMQQYPKELYQKLFNWVQLKENAWAMERLWGVMYGNEN